MIKVRRIGHATFETPDLEKQIEHFTQVTGLVVAAREKDRALLASKVTLTATVVAIDSGTRTVTLKGGGGRIVDVVVPPEAKKLDEIKVGDLVTVEYARAVSLTLKKAGNGIRSSTSRA